MLTKAAVGLSGFLILAWIVLVIGVEPESDPNAVLEYIDLTLLLIAALALTWLVVLLVWLGRRFANRNAKPSQRV
jgi:membrane protein implicated in regulation of membrane protease activity